MRDGDGVWAAAGREENTGRVGHRRTRHNWRVLGAGDSVARVQVPRGQKRPRAPPPKKKLAPSPPIRRADLACFRSDRPGLIASPRFLLVPDPMMGASMRMVAASMRSWSV